MASCADQNICRPFALRISLQHQIIYLNEITMSEFQREHLRFIEKFIDTFLVIRSHFKVHWTRC